MTLRKYLAVRACGVPLIAALALGCPWIEPSQPDAQAPHGDSGPAAQDAALVEHDAASAHDSATEDAHTDAAEDGGADQEDDAGAIAESCERDEQCAAEAYCSRVRHSCVARCDAQGACIGPSIAASNNRVLTDGTHVCYADEDQPLDHVGDASVATYVVRAWDGAREQPSTLGSGTDVRVLLVADGYCYYHAASALKRARLSGGGEESLQALPVAPRRAWLTEDAVWWTVANGDRLDLYRLARSGPDAGQPTTAELLASVPSTNLWEAGNRTHLFRRFKPSFASCAVVMAPIADLTNETTIPMSFSKNCHAALWANDESLLFVQFEPVHYYPFRVDFSNLALENTVRLHSVELLMYQVRGAWVYGQSVVDRSDVVGVPNTVSYQRARLSGEPTERLFTPTPGTASFTVEPYELDDNVYRTFAVLDQRLVYQHGSEQRLLVVALPPEPSD